MDTVKEQYHNLQTAKKVFEADLKELFLSQIQKEDEFCERLYGTLTNTEIYHPTLGVIHYSFREAGGLIAFLKEEGDYLCWYCSAPKGTIDPEIADQLKTKKWEFKHYDLD